MNYEIKSPAELSIRTKEFALRIIRLYCSLPKRTQAQVLGKQVLRSGTSVGANYREAERSCSKVEYIAKIGDCLKELDETAYWLELLVESGIVNPSNMKTLHQECNELLAPSQPFPRKQSTRPFILHNSSLIIS